MTWPAWHEDSVARRFILTIAMVVAGTMMLVVLFLNFGGNWARPPLQKSGLFERAADIYRLIDAAPVSVRPQLVAAVANDKLAVAWFPQSSPVSQALDRSKDLPTENDVTSAVTQLLGEGHRILVFKPDYPAEARVRGIGPASHDGWPTYSVALALPDGSWLAFTVDHRLWGLAASKRWMVWITFLVLATSVVTAFAARRLIRPIRQFSDAIQLFGTNPQAPPMEEIGPAEFRGVIAAFNTMQCRIQRLISARTAMLAAISHDLRTPLTRIRLRGELIADPIQQARLFRDVDELQQMIDGALAFFRGDAQQEAVTSLDLPSILQTIVSDFSDQGVAVTYGGPARLPYLGRPIALKRAVSNLVENAIKYGTPPAIGLVVEPSQVIITVTDKGPGIPEEALEPVFTPFYRLEKSRNRATGGVGLGLTATRSIIREHGGEVILTNLPEGGLEARITLPDTAVLIPGAAPR